MPLDPPEFEAAIHGGEADHDLQHDVPDGQRLLAALRERERFEREA